MLRNVAGLSRPPAGFPARRRRSPLPRSPLSCPEGSPRRKEGGTPAPCPGGAGQRSLTSVPHSHQTLPSRYPGTGKSQFSLPP